MKISLLATTLQDRKGSVLVGLIIAIIIFAALGAAMLSLTSTSAVNQVWANSSSRAYYLAESGFRYAKTEYKNALDIDGDVEIEDDRNQLLENWHSPEPPSSPVLFTFSNNMEKFELKIYPYYFVTSVSHSAGATTTLQTEFCGEKPADFTVPSSGKLKIGLKSDSDPPYTYNGYDSGTGVFTLSTQLLSSISDNMNVYLVTNPSSVQNLTDGGDFTLADASFFPERNGIFSIDDGDGTVYAYKSKNVDTDTLQDIFDVNDPDRTFNVSTLTSDDIVLNPFVKLHSTGIVDYGSSTEIRREIVYHVPLSVDVQEKAEFHDTFEDKSKWEDSALGAHEIQTIGGDSALRVISTESFGGSQKASLIGLDWSATNVDLATAHRRGNKYFLDYDAQVKTGYTTTSTPPDHGYLPEPIPLYFAAGLSFRLDENLNSYGLSFLRGSNNTFPLPDRINDLLIPQPPPSPPGKDQRLLIVLWQKSGPFDEDSNWLAYKDIDAPALFNDNIEFGEEKWTKQAPWERTDIDSHSGNYCWHDSIAGNYANNIDISLTSNTINLSCTSEASLTFWHHYDVQPWDDLLSIGDRADVEISTDGGTIWTTLNPVPYGGFQGVWTEETIDLTPYAGESNVKIRFRLRTDNTNQQDGWYIDDVKVSGGDFPINEATLLVRIKESASIAFDNGGTSPIVDGDVLAGASASGIVNGTPIIASGSWAGNDAAGTILLANVSGIFSDTEQLTVNGTLVSARARNPMISRANYIRAYYGDVDGCGTPNIDPFDYEKHGNPRNPVNVNWTPDEVDDWSADNDYFTLIQWDELNTAIISSELMESLDEPGAVIRSTESVLFTPSSGVFNRSELGLHTFGHGSLNVYFDDFALQTEIYSTGGFLPEVQE